jgi:hypothetical protein
MNAGGNTTIFDKYMNRIIKASYEVIALDNIEHEAYIDFLHDNITYSELLEIRKVIASRCM